VQQLTEVRIPAQDLRFSRDASEYQRIANDPSVLPFIAPKGIDEIDLTAFFEEPKNLGFMYRDCAFLVHWLEPGVYEVHSMALPNVRGRYVYEAASTSIRYMFFATDAMELLTKVVDGNVAATALARKVRFSPEYTRPGIWMAEDGPKDVQHLAIRYPGWVKHQDWLRAGGEWFHSLAGVSEDHPDDAAHDLYVGAMVETVLGGQPDKAVILYNRWARFAGYDLVSIVDYSPLTFEVSGHHVIVDGTAITITPCEGG
jgi:hypothetical protein